MSQSLCWIDRTELTQALFRVGFAAAVPGRSAPPRRPRREHQPRAHSPFHGTPSSAASPALSSPGFDSGPGEAAWLDEFEDHLPSSGTLQHRLEAFFEWVLKVPGCLGLFVVDEEGLVLMEHNADPILIALSSSFMSLLQRVRASLDSRTLNSIAFDLEAGQVLQLSHVETDLGRYALGILLERPVERSHTVRFQRGLASAMEETLEPALEEEEAEAPA